MKAERETIDIEGFATLKQKKITYITYKYEAESCCCEVAGCKNVKYYGKHCKNNYMRHWNKKHSHLGVCPLKNPKTRHSCYQQCNGAAQSNLEGFHDTPQVTDMVREMEELYKQTCTHTTAFTDSTLPLVTLPAHHPTQTLLLPPVPPRSPDPSSIDHAPARVSAEVEVQAGAPTPLDPLSDAQDSSQVQATTPVHALALLDTRPTSVTANEHDSSLGSLTALTAAEAQIPVSAVAHQSLQASAQSLATDEVRAPVHHPPSVVAAVVATTTATAAAPDPVHPPVLPDASAQLVDLNSFCGTTSPRTTSRYTSRFPIDPAPFLAAARCLDPSPDSAHTPDLTENMELPDRSTLHTPKWNPKSPILGCSPWNSPSPSVPWGLSFDELM